MATLDAEALRVAINLRLAANIAGNARRLEGRDATAAAPAEGTAGAPPLAAQEIVAGSLVIVSERPILESGMEVAFSGRLEHRSGRASLTDVPVSGRAMVDPDGRVTSVGLDAVHFARGRPLGRPPAR